MNGRVSAKWLNALIITTTLIIWLSILSSIVIGISVASASTPYVPEEGCTFNGAHWYDENDNYCGPDAD